MQAFTIESGKDELIIRLDKKQIPTEQLLKIIQRLRVEYLAQKAAINDDLTEIADEIDKKWWRENGADFLKNVKK